MKKIIPGLYAYYPFNGHIRDVIGRNTGVASNIKFGSGLNTGSVYFAGLANSYVTIPNNSMTSSPIFTYSLWVKSLGGATNNAIIGGTVNSNVQFRFYSVSSPGAIGIIKQNIAEMGGNVSSYGLNLNQWAQVAVSYSSPDITYYCNGKLIGRVSNAQTFTWTNRTIGSHSTDGESFYGYLSDVMMFNRILTPNEINKIYQIQKRKYNPNLVTNILQSSRHSNFFMHMED
jgi:hypothetical protein